MKQFQRFLSLLLIPLLFVFYAFPVCAAGIDPQIQSDLQDTLHSAGGDALTDALPDEARALLEQLKIGSFDVGALLSLSPGDFVRVLWSLLREIALLPFTTLGSIVGVVVLCALVDTLKAGIHAKALSSIFSTVGILCIITMLARPITDCILAGAAALRDCGHFMLAFIPVFTSIVTISGAPVTASTYNVLLFTVCQLVSGFASSVLVPLMGLYMGLCIAGSVGEDLGVLPLAHGIRAFVTWSLTFCMTAYAGLLSMQTLVSAGADGAMMKAEKFLVGSFVPIVGGAISDALGATRGAMHLLKTTVGAFGVCAGVALFLPALLRVLMWYFTLKCASFVSGVLTLKKLGGLLEACSNCLATMLALLVSFMVLIIISIVLLLTFSASV